MKSGADDIGEFGLGVVLYFWTLKLVGGLCFVLGCLQLRTSLYFRSPEYSGGGQRYDECAFGNDDADAEDGTGSWSWMAMFRRCTLVGSAWCPDRQWIDVPVWDPNCGFEPGDAAGMAPGPGACNQTLVVHNCPLDSEQVYREFACTCLMVLFIVAMEHVQVNLVDGWIL